MTATEFLTAIAYNNCIQEEIREFAKKELAKFTTDTRSTITDTQRKHEELKQQILDEMIEGRQYTISAMQNSLKCCSDKSAQKISALMRQLVESGKVIRREKPNLFGGAVVVYILA